MLGDIPERVGNLFRAKRTSENESLVKSLLKNRKVRVGIYIFAAFVIIALIGKFFPPYNPMYDHFPKYLAPNSAHLLGTDYAGHDVLSQYMYGTGVSLYVGFVVALIAVILGTLVGLISGYYGGLVDNFLMRFVDILLILPTFPLLVILSAYFTPTVDSTILILGVLSWPFMSRVIRSQTLTVKQRPFIQASVLAGMGGTQILFRELFLFILPLVIINAVYIFVGAIVAQAGLAFFGLGDLASINWGTMLYYAQAEDAVIYNAYWWIIPPGISIAILGIAANILGNGVTEVFGERAGSV